MSDNGDEVSLPPYHLSIPSTTSSLTQPPPTTLLSASHRTLTFLQLAVRTNTSQENVFGYEVH